MARKEYEVEVVNGPNNFDLMFALFDETTRWLYFRTIEDDIQRLYGVYLVSLKKLYRNDTDNWEVNGICHAYSDATKVTIKYRSDTRKGTIYFDSGEAKEMSGDDKKARALMIVIEKMVAAYQNFQSEHGYKQDEKFFELFNLAKGVHFAENPKSLKYAIEQIK